MPAAALRLRLADPADAPAIRALTRAAYAKWVPLIGREPKPMGADYEAAVRLHRFDVLEAEGVLAALLETIPAADHLLVENLAVAPAFQRRGLGRRLMAQAEHLARAAGLSQVRLYTNARFTENIRLYASLGYAETGREALPVGVAVHMAKTLPPTGP